MLPKLIYSMALGKLRYQKPHTHQSSFNCDLTNLPHISINTLITD